MDKSKIDVVRELMLQGLQMVPVTDEDLVTGTGVVAVNVHELYEFGQPPKSIGGNGTTLLFVKENPVRDHPESADHKAVFFNRPDNQNRRWIEVYFELGVVLRDEFDPRESGTLAYRFFVRK